MRPVHPLSFPVHRCRLACSQYLTASKCYVDVEGFWVCIPESENFENGFPEIDQEFLLGQAVGT